MVVTQGGTNIGTVTKVMTNGQGVVTRVLVRGANGQTYSVAPGSLSVSGGTLVATGVRLR